MMPLTRLDYYLDTAQNWSLLFNKNFGQISAQTIICELLPGWAPKIPLALELLEFQGLYIAVDENKEYLKTLAFFLEQTCRFDFSTKQKNIFDGTLPQADLYLMNHGIDDLLLYQQGEIYFDQASDLGTKWKQIEENKPAVIEQTTAKLLKLLSSLKKGSSVFFLQYPSYHDTLLANKTPYLISKECLKLLHQKATEKGVNNSLSFLPAASYNAAEPNQAVSLRINL